MTTFTVMTAADVVNAGDGVLSLREAVQKANASEVSDEIRFAMGLKGQAITLTQVGVSRMMAWSWPREGLTGRSGEGSTEDSGAYS